MNITFKKLISLITTLTMCTSIVGITNVSAADGSSGSGTENDPYLIKTVDDNGATQEEFASDEGAYLLNNSGTYANSATKRPLTVEYMGMGNAPTATGKKSASLTSDDISSSTTDKPFWIGLAVEKVNDMDLFTNGVYSLEVAFEYDPSYIRPVIGSGDTETKWHDEIVAANVGSGKAWNEKYTVVSVAETDLDTESDRADKGSLSSRSNWKMCVVCITLDAENDTDLRFKGLDQQTDAAAKKYLLNIPFRLVKAPAEGDSDMNPTVLSLVRGPDTFNIGSGKTGESPKAKWNDTENQNDAENLQTYFNYPNDIKLFGSGVSITDIMPFRVEDQLDENGNPKKDGDGKVLTEEKDYKLSQDATLQGEGFNPELTSAPHYGSVSNLPDNVQLRITADDMPTVKVNGVAVNVTLKDGKYVTNQFSLNELDKKVNNGFNNTITVQDSSGNTEYTILFRRLLQPKIELVPGNSPYGLIERMSEKYLDYRAEGESTEVWDAQKIQDAKDKFDNNGAINKQYASGYVPINGEPTLKYVTEAWRDYKDKDGNIINYDMDPNALFVYMDDTFKVPKGIIIDEEGNEITSATPTISILLDQQTKAGEMVYDSNDNIKQNYEPKLVEGSTDLYSLVGIMVRMNVYEIKYNYTYTRSDGVKVELTAYRPIIVISKRGDVLLNSTVTVNDGDVDHLRDNQSKINTGPSLVAYRCLDFIVGASANATPTINDGDVDHLRDNQSSINTSTVQYYKKIK